MPHALCSPQFLSQVPLDEPGHTAAEKCSGQLAKLLTKLKSLAVYTDGQCQVTWLKFDTPIDDAPLKDAVH